MRFVILLVCLLLDAGPPPVAPSTGRAPWPPADTAGLSDLVGSWTRTLRGWPVASISHAYPSRRHAGSVRHLRLVRRRGHHRSCRQSLGTQVKVDGTVYPAGNAYLIVVDSLRIASP